MDSGALEMRVPKELKQQLALAVRSINWSYGIFWSISATQPGALEWRDGYYNGDIMTRKTVQGMELNADKVALQRSDQLRELYESLSVGESSSQTKRPSAALSPEDLTDTEWYYLVCMSFVFEIGQGMPGKTLAKGQPMWLCDASYDDSKVFTRTLLAKSASIQTVVCFPFLGGVIELGATDSVLEDPSLIHHVKASFLEVPYWNCGMIPIMGDLAMEGTSPTTSSNCFVPKQPVEESFMIDAVEDFSDCVSQTFVQQRDEHELHYESVLSQLLKSCDPLKFGRHFKEGKCDSSFETWKKAGWIEKRSYGTHQRVLKRILFEVPRLHDIVSGDGGGGGGLAVGVRHLYRPEADEIRSKQMNERYGILKSLMPYNVVPKPDKTCLLDNTIEYLKDLERKVEELEESWTSDNYGNKFWNKTLVNKRKAKEIDDVSNHLVVKVDENEVLIEMRCGWKEGVLLEIVTVVGNLRLDSHSVQTSTEDGILSVTIKSKFSGSSVMSPETIKQALQRFVHR